MPTAAPSRWLPCMASWWRPACAAPPSAAPTRLHWEVAGYYTALRNEILSIDSPAAPGTSLSANIDKTTHAGIESLLGASFAIGRRAHRIEPLLNITFNAFSFDSDADYGNNRLPSAPRCFARGEVMYRNASGFSRRPDLRPHRQALCGLRQYLQRGLLRAARRAGRIHRRQVGGVRRRPEPARPPVRRHGGREGPGHCGHWRCCIPARRARCTSARATGSDPPMHSARAADCRRSLALAAPAHAGAGRGRRPVEGVQRV